MAHDADAAALRDRLIAQRASLLRHNTLVAPARTADATARATAAREALLQATAAADAAVRRLAAEQDELHRSTPVDPLVQHYEYAPPPIAAWTNRLEKVADHASQALDPAAVATPAHLAEADRIARSAADTARALVLMRGDVARLRAFKAALSSSSPAVTPSVDWNGRDLDALANAATTAAADRAARKMVLAPLAEHVREERMRTVEAARTQATTAHRGLLRHLAVLQVAAGVPASVAAEAEAVADRLVEHAHSAESVVRSLTPGDVDATVPERAQATVLAATALAAAGVPHSVTQHDPTKRTLDPTRAPDRDAVARAVVAADSAIRTVRRDCADTRRDAVGMADAVARVAAAATEWMPLALAPETDAERALATAASEALAQVQTAAGMVARAATTTGIVTTGSGQKGGGAASSRRDHGARRRWLLDRLHTD
ncbi:hypothetical protein BC828DRAFT_382306 [Blastocladiella britannica]|nr:hypothetical protein BC828DRAFT_382306 [Blastocladiella britannica]